MIDMDLDAPIASWLSTLHSLFAVLALLVAPLAMVMRKGGDGHRRWGKVFFYCTIALGAMAGVLFSMDPHQAWFALVAVFSLHLAMSGYRSLYLKKLHEGQRPGNIDRALNGVALVVYGGLLFWGTTKAVIGEIDLSTIALLGFGFLGTFLTVASLLRFYRRSNDKHQWLFGHMGGFLGAYIATACSLSAVNFTIIQPLWLRWTWPLFLGLPMLVVWMIVYKRRFASGTRLRETAEVQIR